MCSCMSPSGKQCASGLSLLFSALRLVKRSAAHGNKGRPSLNPCPMFLKLATGGPEGGGGGGAAGASAGGCPLGPPFCPPRPPPPPGPPGPPRRAQTPEKSG